MELVDNAGVSLSPAVTASSTFTVDDPCDLVLGDIATTCDALTSGTDTFNGSIAFTGGNTGVTYTITAPGGVTVGGDNPDSVAAGTITFTGMTEGSDAAITIVGNAGSSCNYSRTLFSPFCVSFPVEETFNYTVDTDLIAADAWQDASTSSTPNNIQIKAPTLGNYYSSDQFPDPTHNMVSLVGSGSDPFIGFNETDSGVLYASFLFHITDMTDFKSNTNGGYFVVLAEPGGGFRVRFWVKDNTAGTTNEGLTYHMGISAGTNTGNFDASFTSNILEPNFIVLAYDFTTDEVKLWINPDPTSFDTTNVPTPNVTVAGGTASSLERFILRQDSTSETPSIDFDELRIGTTWAQVTPRGTSASVRENAIGGFAAFPNPINDKRFTITTNSTSEKNVKIFNVLGKQVFTTSFFSNNALVDISSLNTGMYILKVIEGRKTATKKLVVR